MWAQMGDRATEGALGSRGTTSGGHGALLVPGALPQPPPPQCFSPGWQPRASARPITPLALATPQLVV